MAHYYKFPACSVLILLTQLIPNTMAIHAIITFTNEPGKFCAKEDLLFTVIGSSTR